ncbi:sulfurtransferase [Polaribacter porphyrae]|uniref:Rhodanese domain-containing protein n=1 Tax=Polaribacter porphyrae TaxID=1137780 RepID=A0A2S7WL02_9FLAO|nr:sulfurtransferase [Polaribacter porphyrae]PQJ78284.1 hypothetical protein BTO18_03350 [Polaribacter porphyrae]
MSLKIPNNIVSVDWLYQHLNDKNIIILNATIAKVTSKKDDINAERKYQIQGARFFDIKNKFSDIKAPFPNTVLSPKEFEDKAQLLGINKDSCIVVYDDLGIYSSPRVWWLFQLMGFNNIAVLNGGFPEWKSKKYPIEEQQNRQVNKGNFLVDYQSEKITYTKDVLNATTNKHFLIVDARSKGRFYATEPEPRKGLQGGHIPNSVNLPHLEIINDGKIISKAKLEHTFNQINPTNKNLIFSCGSGITASILALGATLAKQKNIAVYDGSWTEWASTNNLPITK